MIACHNESIHLLSFVSVLCEIHVGCNEQTRMVGARKRVFFLN